MSELIKMYDYYCKEIEEKENLPEEENYVKSCKWNRRLLEQQILEMI